MGKILEKPETNNFRFFRRRFARNKLAAVALCFIVFQIILAVAAPYIAPYDPYKGDFLATWEKRRAARTGSAPMISDAMC
jgi:ABC-type antimicrobial peptide transport system permease subunit